MPVVAAATVDVAPDLGNFAAKLQSDLRGALTGVTRSVRTSTADMSRSLSSVGTTGSASFRRLETEASSSGSKMGGAFKKAAAVASVAFAGIAVGGFLKDAVGQASDLNESVNAVQVTLGKGSQSFLNFGKSAATNLGLTQAQLNQAIVPTASLLKNAGVAGDDLSSKLQTLATRATDVGSVYNQDVNQVLVAFGAALRGEQEPIRQFGVSLDDNSIRAEAVKEGLAKSTKEVSQSAKVQAAYTLILQQTSTAQGDFANTADGVANASRIVKASFEEMKASVGTAILPAVKGIMAGLLPAIKAVQPALATIGTAVGQALVAITPILTTLGPLFADTFAKLTPAIAPLAAAVGSVMTAFAPLLPVFANLAGQIIPPLAAAFTQIVTGLMPIIPAIITLVPTLLQLFTALLPLIPILTQLAVDLVPVLTGAIVALNAVAGPLITAIGAIVGALSTVLTPLLQSKDAMLAIGITIGAVLLPILPFLIAGLVGLAVSAGAAALSFAAAALPFIAAGAAIAGVAYLIIRFHSQILNAVKTAWNAVRTAVSTAVSFVVNFVRSHWMLLVAIIAGPLGLAVGLIIRFRSQIVGAFRAAWNGALSAVKTGVNAVVSFVKGAPGKILGVFGDAGHLLYDVGTKIISGLKDGIVSKFDDIKNTLGNLTGKLTSWKGPPAKDKKLLKPTGQQIMQGLIDGLSNKFPAVQSVLQAFTDEMAVKLPKSVASSVKKAESELERLGKKNDKVTASLDSAKQALTDIKQQAKDYSASIRDAVNSLGDVTKAPVHTFAGIKDELTAAANQAAQFRTAITQLSKLNLNQDQIDNLIAAGPTADSLATAEALISGGAAGIAQINQLTTSMDTTGKKLGKSASSALYDAGVESARGLVAGLESQEKAIEAQMTKIGDKLVLAIKKALHIKSPSALLADEVGEPSGHGIIKGLMRTTGSLQGAAGGMAESAVQGVRNADTSGGGGPVTVEIHATGPTLADIVRVTIRENHRALKSRAVAGSRAGVPLGATG